MSRCSLFVWVVCCALTPVTGALAQEAPRSEPAGAEQGAEAETQSAAASASAAPDEVKRAPVPAKRLSLTKEALREAFVKVRSGPMTSFGVLMGDRSTVLFAGMFSEPGRDVGVRGLGQKEWIDVPRESLRVYTEQRVMKFYVAKLPEPVEGTPLALGTEELRLGEAYHVVHLIPGPMPVISNYKTLLVSEYETGGDLAGMVPPGTLVLDEQGRLVAVVAMNHQAVELDVIRSGAGELGAAVAPLFGLRAGPRFRGPAGTGAELRVEAGVTFWDRMSLALHSGFSSTTDTDRVSLEDDEWGRGVALANRNSFFLGAELRYRMLFFETFGGGFYLDLAAGGEVRWVYFDPESPALFSRDPSCDPLSGACPVTMRDGNVLEEEDDDTLLGAQFGADLRFGAFSMGYRYYPSALWTDGSDSHLALFGFSFM